MEHREQYTRAPAPATLAPEGASILTEADAPEPGRADAPSAGRSTPGGLGCVELGGDGPEADTVQTPRRALALVRGGRTGTGGAIPEPRSVSAGVIEAHSLAPSHKPNTPGSRSGGQGRSRGAPPQRSEAERGGDGAPLTEASTPAPCEETGPEARGSGAPSGGPLGGPSGSVTARAVTPGRFDGGGSDSIHHGPDAGGARLLRVAMDWMACLCLCPVTAARWVELAELARHGCAVQIPTASGTVPMEWRRMGKDIVGRSVAGLFVLLREPESCALVEVPRCAVSKLTGADPREGSRASFAWSRLSPAPAAARAEDDADTRELRDVDASTARTASPARCRGSADVLISAGLQSRPASDVKPIYGVELQVQGQAFSSVKQGGAELVRALWRGLVEWLHAGRWDDPDAVLRPLTFPGRCDWAFDTAFTAAFGAEWVQSGIFADGDHDACFRRFSTRATKRQSEETVKDPDADGAAAELDRVPVSGRRALLGKATAGRTAYMGSAAYVLLCIYERSKKVDGDWAVLSETLRACGWDGVSEVVRAEFRVSRKWLKDQIARNEDGSPVFPRTSRARGEHDGLSLGELTLAEFLDVMPRVVAEMPSRFRHTDPAQDNDAGPRVRDRRSSGWWSAVEGGALHWASGSGDVGRVVSTRRHAAADRTIKQIRTGLVRLIGLRGGRNLSDVLPEVFEAWAEPDFEEQRSLLIQKVRARYAIPDPPPALAAVG